ncbi:MAG: patatin-like phospholipase family protein [Actinomycetota bacterium]|nr:patatin-like phospholipase family protein [Actinomycetota bacterium]
MAHMSPLGESPLFGLLPAHLQDELVAAAQPVRVSAREWLFHAGDAGDCLYVVVSGRMRVLAERDGRIAVLNTLGPGAVIGELALLTGAQRSASVQALRDTELLEIDGERFEELILRDAEFGAGLARALAERIQQGGAVEPSEAPTAVVALTAVPGVDAERLWSELESGLGLLGDAVLLTEPAPGWGGEETWGPGLGDLERAHEFVLLQAALDGSAWSAFCMRQADRVVVATEGRLPADLSPPAGCELVFLRTPSIEDVASWTKADPRAHYVVTSDQALPDATRRLARRLTGRSLGIVLSGGGARAFAHIGVLQALAEEKIVIDRFGGCSMGAFVAGMAALGRSPEAMVEICHQELSRRAPFSDYTFPRHALIRARRAASMLQRVFGDVALEQLACPLFTVSADLLSSRMVVHRTGSLIEAVGSSMAIPGLAPPVLRRAELLVDGGILNNLPIDVMAGAEPGPVVAVDVMRRLESDDPDLNPQALLPTILETLSRATVLGSVERAEANRELADLLITPDVQDISLRGFKHVDRAVAAGRRAAEEALAAGGKEALEPRARHRAAAVHSTAIVS